MSMKLFNPNDFTMVSTNVLEDEFLPYDIGVDYVLPALSVIHNHHIWTALTENGPTTTVVEPGTNALVWKDEGATNAYAFSDKYWRTSTSNPVSIEIVLEATYFDSIALLNFTGVSVDIEVRNPTTSEVVYAHTVTPYEIIKNPSRSLFDFFYRKRKTKKDLLIEFQTFPTAHIMIRINHPSAVASLGKLLICKQHPLGHAKFSPTLDLVDYSKQSIDPLTGEPFITQGNSAKRNSYSVFIENEYLDETVDMIDEVRSLYMLFVGVRGKSSFMTYGFYKNFSLVYQNHKISEYQIQIEGIAI